MTDNAISITNLKQRMAQAWRELWDFLNDLEEDDLTKKRDHAGWTIKDHIVHIAFWEIGIAALLKKQSRTDAMGFAANMWDMGTDAINAAIQTRSRSLSWVEVKAMMEETHEQLLTAIDTLTDEDLTRPYNYFDPAADISEPVLEYIVGNSFGHYEEHLPWMRAMIAP